MKKYLRPALLTLLVLLVLGQFIRPEKNVSGDDSKHLSTKFPIPADVEAILKPACYPCHSNHTDYPWYAEIQPVAWWLGNHVKHGKSELNFSTFAGRRVAVQNHKFEEIAEMVGDGNMPLKSFTYFGLHPDAKMTDGQRKLVIDWAKTQMDSLKARYPADSLVMKKRPQ